MRAFIQDDDELNESYLIHQLARLTTLCFERRAENLNLTRVQWKLIALIRRNPGISQAALAQLMEVAPMSLVHLLDRLERKHWIKRTKHATDRRANKIYLDTRATPLVKKMRAIALEMRRDMTKGLTPEEHGRLLDYLKRIKHTLAMEIETSLKDKHA